MLPLIAPSVELPVAVQVCEHHGSKPDPLPRHNWIGFILLLWLWPFLSSPLVLAQTSSPPPRQLVPAQDQTPSAPTSAPIAAASFFVPSLPPFGRTEKSDVHFYNVYAGSPKRAESLESLSPMREVKTPFLTQSSLPLVQLWSGRVRLDGFSSRLDMRSVQLGPSSGGGLMDFRPPRQAYPGGLRSIGFYGVNLSFHPGREAQVERPDQIWRCLTRIAGGHVAKP